MEELNRNLKIISQALNDLSAQLRGLELGQGAGPSLLPSALDKQPQRSSGYVNWNSAHDRLKTEYWMKMSQFTEYCGMLERGADPDFDVYIRMQNRYSVDEETRFPKDGLYVNVSNPLIHAEILYIKELRKPATDLVDRFLNKAKDETHTFSSFEKKHGLNWIEPSTEANDVVKSEPMQETVSKPVNETNVKPIPGSWCLSEDQKLEEVELLSKEELSDEDLVTQELREQFTDILDQLTKQKFDTLLNKVKKLKINNQKRMEVIVEQLLEKALEKPCSSELYATLASELSTLKVPSENNPDQQVNFRDIFIGKVQNLFEVHFEMEKEYEDNNDPTVTKLDNMITRLRAVANAKFIGELYKKKLLTYKIVEYCLKKLFEKDQFECLCELINTAGKQFEKEAKIQCDNVFKNMQELIDLKSGKISSPIECMLQDVIDLRNRRWVNKPVVKALPKTMDEIQEESQKRALLIELMNEFHVKVSGGDSGGDVIRREEDGHTKHASKNFYSIDALKLEAATQETQNYIQHPPESFMTLSDSVLEKLQADPTSRTEMSTADLSVLPSLSTYQSNNASIGRSTDYAPVVPQVPINDSKFRSSVKYTVDNFLINPDKEELVVEVKHCFPLQYHAAAVKEILLLVFDKTTGEIEIFVNLLLHLVATNTISQENFVAGLKEILADVPDLLIDIPRLYEYLGMILAPHIEKNHITLAKIFELSELIITADQGDRLLESIIDCLNEDVGHEFVGNMWRESGLQLSQWMREELVAEWVYNNDFEFLNFDSSIKKLGDKLD